LLIFLSNRDNKMNLTAGGSASTTAGGSAVIKEYVSLTQPTREISFTPETKKTVAQFSQLTKQLKGLRLDFSYSPSTHAERYEMLTKTTTHLPWFALATEHATFQAPESTRRREASKNVFTGSSALASGASERTAVQPYWTTVITRLKDCNSSSGFTVILKDTHKIATIGGLKPDIVGYVKNKPESIFYIALVGELKARRARSKADFDSAEKGQLESYLEKLLHMQLHRSHATGFLSDGFYIQFFRLSREQSGILKFVEGPVESLEGAGGLWLLGALSSLSMEANIDICVDSTAVDLHEFVGEGASSMVYLGTYNDKKIVVKHYRPGKEDLLKIEKKNLQLVSDLQPAVSAFVAASKSGDALLLEPMGEPFNSEDRASFPAYESFAQLIGILKRVHDKGLVHRDVRMCNFFRHPETEEVFLNDWGSATKIGEKTTFAGALRHAPDEVLSRFDGEESIACTKYTPKPAHDLEMLVKCVFQLIWPAVYSEIKNTMDPGRILNFWQTYLRGSIWEGLLHAARDTNYLLLTELFQALIPPNSPITDVL